MALVTLEQAKAYLRVDSDYEDPLIQTVLDTAGRLCADVARFSDEEWEAVDSKSQDEAAGTVPTPKLKARRELMTVAVLFTVGYLYEHREEADHHALALTLRSLLSSIREGVV